MPYRDIEEKRLKQRLYARRHRERLSVERSAKARQKTAEYMKRTRQDGAGQIYFAQTASGPIKIGYTTKQPIGRLKELQAGNHEELTLLLWFPAIRDEEWDIHHRFRHLKIRGEWFKPEQELLEYVRLRTTTASSEQTCLSASKQLN